MKWGLEMLIAMAEILKDAKKRNYGVAAPNIFNKETIEAAYEAADELNAPIILDFAGLKDLGIISEISRFYERKYPHVSAALNLDHGGSYEEIIMAIRSGFTSVMIDRSMLPYNQNVEQVKEIVKIAKNADVSVEAELGHVGMGYEYESTRDSGLTKSEEAINYVKETGIDCLAVAVGTSHGTYSGVPHLEFELLEKLHHLVEIPLVLHGGSGTGDDNLKKAVKIGIQKVNLFTDLSNAGLKVLRNYLTLDRTKIEHDKESGEFGNKNANLVETFMKGTEGYKEALKHYMTLFESCGKA